ncbi:transposase, partial [Trichloromonas sp.]|uniref:transposase n=1 Tax=Trichloromonas sp. TaxID=3069249 RepID=UPI002A3C2150|nr:transposase [Trichloromonas sp.]
RRAKEKTAAFREVYRFRAGAEATMSDLDRVTGIKHLRVRGMRQVRLAAVLKATGLNILRATAFRNRQKPKGTRETGTNLYPNDVVGSFKELSNPLRGYLRHLAESFRPGNNRIGRLMPQAA